MVHALQWYARGMFLRIACDYPVTTSKGSSPCKNKTLGEWHRCHQHRHRWLRRTDRHAVDGEGSLILWDARTRTQLAALAKAPSWPDASDYYYQPRLALTADGTVLGALIGGKLLVFSTETRQVLW